MSAKDSLENTSDGPKYKRIYQKLRETLANGTYIEGNKLPSENELVESFGASRPTVRRALAQLESEGLIQRRMGSGTVVAKRSAHNALVFGLLIPELGMTEIFEPICQGISQAHVSGQHDLLWGPTSSQGVSKDVQAQHLCRYYIDRKVSGVFFAPMEHFAGGDGVNLSITQALDEAQIPVVLLDRDVALFPARSKYDVVGINNVRAGYILAEHLLLSGSRRIAFLARPYSAHTVEARIAGYQLAVRYHLGPEAEALVKWGDPSDVVAMREFLDRAQPDAIICANDYTAAQLLTTLNDLGIQVPSQIRVAGMDDVKYASLLQTPLTTIHQPCQDLGATALFAMLNRIANPTAPSRDFLLDFKLVVRKSTEPNAHTQPDTNTVDHNGTRDSIGTEAEATEAIPVPSHSRLRPARQDSF
jgi:DNA-binding LacI/PurR family transcriptional regulator